jgi:uncharacterized membrane protein YfcA
LSSFFDLTHLFLALIVITSTFINTVAGFGNALIAMPLMIALFGFRQAAPLQTMLGIVTFLIILLRYRRALNFGAVWRIILASVVMIPVGVLVLARAPERVTLPILGGVILVYVGYRVLALPMPAFSHPAFTYFFGALAGLLGGAFNTSGPPVILYGDARRWQPEEFRSNLTSIFLVNSTIVALTHGLAGNITPVIWQNWLFALPFIGVGVGMGFLLNPYINPDRFRQFVLFLLFVIGLRLVWAAFGA